MSSRTFQFHQTIHGYDDGHRLLATSQSIPSNIDRLLLILSDMSGSSMVRGFENYLTGYPLKELKSYAIARTWYAPEMKRPGCVWTHTLIISNADLAHLDPTLLPNLFVHPSTISHKWNYYSSTCIFEQPNTSPKCSVETPIYLTKNILEGLYKSGAKQVFLPVDQASSEYEFLTLAIWRQQWARLRRNFLFCTGAITNRKFPDDTFDWQIIPRSAIRETKLEVPKAIFINTESKESERLPEFSNQWLTTALNDLYQGQEVGFRSFMRMFGIETNKGRSSFSLLAQTFTTFKEVRINKEKIKDLTYNISKLFPDRDKGKKIKETFYGLVDKSLKKIPFSINLSEFDVLNELSSTEHYNAFDAEALQITKRASSLTKANFKEAGKIAYSILELPLTPLGEKFLDGFCEGIISNGSIKLSNDQFEFVFPLIDRNPKLATSPEIWRGTEQHQRKVFEHIRKHQNFNTDDVDLIVTAMLQANSDYLANDFSYYSRNVVVKSVLDYCNLLPIEEVFSIGRQWKLLLSDNSSACIQWLKINNESISGAVLLATLLNPHSFDVSNYGSKIWLNLAQNFTEIKEKNILVAIASFLLSLGFKNLDKQAVELVNLSFEVIYKAAENDNLNEHNWGHLARQAPSVSWGGDWNKCERLRSALIEHYVKHKWSHEDFLICLKNSELFESVVWQIMGRVYLFGLDSHQKFLKKTAEKALSGKIYSTDAQKNVLAMAFDI